MIFHIFIIFLLVSFTIKYIFITVIIVLIHRFIFVILVYHPYANLFATDELKVIHIISHILYFHYFFH